MTLDLVFTLCATIGGGMFLVQLMLQFLGGGFGDSDVDIDFHDPGSGHVSADLSFKVLSLQGLSAFLMMFGLVGLATWRGRGEDEVLWSMFAIGAGFVGGTATTWVIARIFRMAIRLQSSGTWETQQWVGATGAVTLTVHRERPGKVSLTVGNRMIEMEAIASDEDQLETGTLIRVKSLVGDRLLSVERSTNA